MPNTLSCSASRAKCLVVYDAYRVAWSPNLIAGRPASLAGHLDGKAGHDRQSTLVAGAWPLSVAWSPNLIAGRPASLAGHLDGKAGHDRQSTLAFAQVGFGTSYLRNSRLCHQWNCVNVKLGLTDTLPPREQFSSILDNLLPAEWHDAGVEALDTCYGNRTRRYTNTCPGQALIHCVVDNLMANCPDDKWAKEDGCNPVSALAGSKYMFSQSRYANLKQNILKERRPKWFLEHYFSTKCCELPQLFNSTVLTECGFDTFLLYHLHDPQIDAHLTSEHIRPLSSNHLRASISHYIPVRSQTPAVTDTTNFGGIEENERKRRQLCNVPNFVDMKILKECGVESVASIEHAPETPALKRGWTDGGKCKEETSSTTCIMQKMDVLNKYNFIDYFKLKERLRNFCQGVWSPMRSAYSAAYNAAPLYAEHCSSPNKLLNVLDTMLAVSLTIL
ncbi:hypothetical protein RR48_00923 [Papilio machaon]|uniref:Uncharacterized protein n=1 Tax=Papilio machaon TaxID=76193 RepID=A0A0N0PCK8_PAPMA|nr:hypothetical protein RR48_00923 [Papilio machaon]